jgi:hypothetical protein
MLLPVTNSCLLKMEMNKTFNIKFSELNLSVSKIENDMGYQEGEDRELVTSIIEECMKETSGIANIKAEYRIYENIEFIVPDNSLNINNINFQITDVLFKEIARSESLAVFICTAGEEIGLRSRKALQEGDFLKGFILDVIGSEVVDGTADILQDELEKKAGLNGKKITNRYSPGYCGWTVAEQHKLFQLLPDNFCGITLTHSALMNPVKSISGIIGIGEHVNYNEYTCRLCDQKDCTFRKKSTKKELSD